MQDSSNGIFECNCQEAKYKNKNLLFIIYICYGKWSLVWRILKFELPIFFGLISFLNALGIIWGWFLSFCVQRGTTVACGPYCICIHTQIWMNIGYLTTATGSPIVIVCLHRTRKCRNQANTQDHLPTLLVIFF